MSSVLYVRAVLGLRKYNVPHTITLALGVYNGINDNPTLYPSLSASMAAFFSEVEALQTAQQTAKSRAPGAADVRDTKRDAVVSTLKSLHAGVQVLMDASPEQAAVLARTAGMKVAMITVPSKAVLGLKAVTPSGSLFCAANAKLLKAEKGSKKRSVTFYWQYTLDGGKTFLSALSTPVARTTLSGLPVLTEVGVRVSLGDSTGQGNWSQVVYELVR